MTMSGAPCRVNHAGWVYLTAENAVG